MPNNSVLQSILDRQNKDNQRSYLKSKSGRELPRSPARTAEERIRKVYHDDIARQLRESKENLNIYFQRERGVSSLKFIHNINSPLEQASYTNFSSTSLDYSASSISTDLSKVKEQAEKDFYDNIIRPSENREKETINFLNMNVSSNINSPMSALQYFNNESIKKVNIPSLRELGSDLENRYIKFTEKPREQRTQADFNTLQNTLLGHYINLRNVLENKIVNMKQFTGYWNLFKGTLEDIVYAKKDVNLEQILKSGTTLLEALEIGRQILIWGNIVNGDTEVEVLSTGSRPSALLKDIMKKYIKKDTKEITTDDIEKAIIRYLQDNPDALTNSKGDMDITSFAASLGVWGAGEGPGGDTVADIAFKFTVKDKEGEISASRIIGADAKLSKEKGGRYTASTGITTNLTSILQSTFSLELNKEVSNRLHTILSFILFLIITKKASAKDFEKNDLTSLVTYALLGSYEFINHYRQYVPGESIGFSQPDFLLLRDGYIWYSEFFKVISYSYFNKSQGRKASIRFKDLIDAEGKILTHLFPDSIINEIDSIRDQLRVTEDLKRINFTEAHIKNYFDTFMNYKINYGFDKSNIMDAVNKIR